MADEKIHAENKSNAEQTISIESRVSSLETKFDMFIGEMRDFKNEMRQQNEMRAAEIREIRTSIDGMGKHVRNVSIATIAVCIASVVGTVTMALTVIFK